MSSPSWYGTIIRDCALISTGGFLVLITVISLKYTEVTPSSKTVKKDSKEICHFELQGGPMKLCLR